MDKVTVFRPGAKVKVVSSAGEWRVGIIQAARIQSAGYVDYNVIWWEAGKRESGWVEEFEVEAVGEDELRTTIGFVQ